MGKVATGHGKCKSGACDSNKRKIYPGENIIMVDGKGWCHERCEIELRKKEEKEGIFRP